MAFPDYQKYNDKYYDFYGIIVHILYRFTRHFIVALNKIISLF